MAKKKRMPLDFDRVELFFNKQGQMCFSTNAKEQEVDLEYPNGDVITLPAIGLLGVITEKAVPIGDVLAGLSEDPLNEN